MAVGLSLGWACAPTPGGATITVPPFDVIMIRDVPESTDVDRDDTDSARPIDRGPQPGRDTVPPRVTRFRTVTLEPVSSRRISLSVEGEDPGPNASGIVAWAITSTLHPTDADFVAGRPPTYFVLPDSPSDQEIYAWARDADGNVSSPPAGLRVRVDASNPRVNLDQSGSKRSPRVAMSSDGSYVVAWHSQCQGGCAMSNNAIMARRYRSDGTAVGSEFRVNTFVTSAPGTGVSSPALASAPSGAFVVAWLSQNQDGVPVSVIAQRFDSAARRVGGEIRVSLGAISQPGAPAVAMNADGSFVVGWAETARPIVIAQRCSAAGSLTGLPIEVGSPDRRTNSVDLATNPVGGFVAVWAPYGQPGDADPSEEGVVARCFDSAGRPRSAAVPVNQRTERSQAKARVATDSNGRFVVVWEDNNRDLDLRGELYNSAVMARRFSADCTPMEGEFQVNEHDLSDPWRRGSANYPGVALTVGGSFVVTWYQLSGASPNAAVFARRFTAGGLALEAPFLLHWDLSFTRADPSIATSERSLAAVWVGYASSGPADVFTRAWTQ